MLDKNQLASNSNYIENDRIIKNSSSIRWNDPYSEIRRPQHRYDDDIGSILHFATIDRDFDTDDIRPEYGDILDDVTEGEVILEKNCFLPSFREASDVEILDDLNPRSARSISYIFQPHIGRTHADAEESIKTLNAPDGQGLENSQVSNKFPFLPTPAAAHVRANSHPPFAILTQQTTLSRRIAFAGSPGRPPCRRNRRRRGGRRGRRGRRADGSPAVPPAV
jgi:hypothetical protein